MQTEKLLNIIHNISYRSNHRISLFLAIDVKKRAGVFLKLSKHIQSQIISQLRNEDILSMIDYLDPEKVTNILRFLSKKKQNELITKLSEHNKKSVSLLLKFDPKTAAGLMNLNYIQVDHEMPVSEVIKHLKNYENKTGKMPTILVMSEGKLKGHLSFSTLAMAKYTDPIKSYIKRIVIIKHSFNYKKVINLFKKNAYNKVVVLNENNAVAGIIYSEDILKLIGEKSSASLYNFAGVNEEESLFDSAIHKIRSRYKWLITNLATAFLASLVVGLFDSTIAKNVLLAVYMPVVAGMGGNAGTQTLAVMVRSLSNVNLTRDMILRTLKNEVIAGATNGLINGTIIAVVVIFLNKNIAVAITLWVAMIINLIVSATFGTLIPVFMKKIGKDPASSATIFITTATDIFGFIVFLGLAKILLG